MYKNLVCVDVIGFKLIVKIRLTQIKYIMRDGDSQRQ